MGDTTRCMIRLGLILVLITVVVFLVAGLQRILVSINNLQQNNLATVERLIHDDVVVHRRIDNQNPPTVWVDGETSGHLIPNTLLTQSVLCELA